MIFDNDHEHLRTAHRLQHHDGTYRWVLCRGLVVRNDAGKVTRMIGSTSDITGQKHAEQQLRHAALHDPLTNLPNRQLFCDQLDQCIARLKRQ
jgi:hypothetical protein